MTKLKSARTLIAILLISVCGGVAVINFVIKPPFWLGAILSIIGGGAIGAVVVYLIWRWWLRRPLAGGLFAKTTRKPKFELGTIFVYAGGTYCHARAGEYLKKGTLVKADLAGRITPPPEPNTMQITSELIWGNVKAAKEVDRHGINVLGWPETNVKKGWYCWLRQPPSGTEFIKEGEKNHTPKVLKCISP